MRNLLSISTVFHQPTSTCRLQSISLGSSKLIRLQGRLTCTSSVLLSSMDQRYAPRMPLTRSPRPPQSCSSLIRSQRYIIKRSYSMSGCSRLPNKSISMYSLRSSSLRDKSLSTYLMVTNDTRATIRIVLRCCLSLRLAIIREDISGRNEKVIYQR